MAGSEITLGDRSAGAIAEWYDELMQQGYTSTKTELVHLVAGACRRCGHRHEATITSRRRTTRIPCPTCVDTTILCRTVGDPKQPVVRQHRPMSASGIGDIHAVLAGAFRFAVQRDWLTATENPMPLGQRPTSRPNKRRPPSAGVTPVGRTPSNWAAT
jgi:hypothetical protein